MKYLFLVLNCLIQLGHSQEFMLSYFDLYADSPSGKLKIVFNGDFSSENPKEAYPGKVEVYDQIGGHILYSSNTFGHTHYGARQFFINDKIIAFQNVKQQTSTIVNIETALTVTIEGALEMASNDGELLVGKRKISNNGAKPKKEFFLYSMNTNSIVSKIAQDSVQAIISECAELAQFCENRGSMKHPKFSPDGTKLFFVFIASDENKRIKKGVIFDIAKNSYTVFSDVGQHPMWKNNDEIFWLSQAKSGTVRRDLITFNIVSSNQTKIENLLANHAIINPIDDEILLSDVYGFPNSDEVSIVETNLSDGSERILFSYPRQDENRKTRIHAHPVWSRDGQSILFNCSDGSKRNICQRTRPI